MKEKLGNFVTSEIKSLPTLNLRSISAIGLFGVFLSSGCSSVPEPKVVRYAFPKDAYVGVPKTDQKFTKLGLVKARVDFPTFHPKIEESELCKNYYNKAVVKLLKTARQQGGDAVVDVKSIVFLVDGRVETYPTPECADEGGEGQVLVQGVAIRWIYEADQDPKIRKMEPGKKSVFVPPLKKLTRDDTKEDKSDIREDSDDGATGDELKPVDETVSKPEKNRVPRPNAPIIPPEY